MDAIERAIRNALEKGPDEDRGFREKVYRQAFTALERALQGNPQITVESAIRRRKALQEKITEIEQEYLPALPALDDEIAAAVGAEFEARTTPAAAPTVPPVEPVTVRPEATFTGHIQMRPDQPAPDEPMPVAPAIRVETDHGPTPIVPDIMVETPAEQAPQPDDSVVDPAIAVAADRATQRSEKRRPFAAIFLGVTLLCAAAIVGWLALQYGLVGRQVEDLAGGIEQPPAESEDIVIDGEPEEDIAPGQPGIPAAERNWIAVFTPSDPSTVAAPGDAKADVLTEASGSFIRIKSGSSGSAVIFDVGQGILEQIAGKRATFDVVARAEEGQDTQMSLSCNFSELGDCGRKRYAVGPTRADYLFDIDMPNNIPGAGGTIAINSDFENGGKAVDIYEIKVSIDQ